MKFCTCSHREDSHEDGKCALCTCTEFRAEQLPAAKLL